MAKTLEKQRKQLAKKKAGGVVDALHARSRDSFRLKRAKARDERLDKLLDSRRRKEQPLRE
jgi:translation machinery-associated protein 16